MSTSPRVSIGLPVRNGENYLSECLESVLAQTRGDFEVVISDNASTDGTPALIRLFAKRDPRIRAFRNEGNHGAAWNFNRVLALSRGQYFKWMAADDVIAREYLESLVPVLDERPDVVLAYPKSALIDANSDVIRPHEDNLHLREETPGERFRRALRGTGKCHPVFGLMRRNVLSRTARIGPFKGADVILLAELSLYGKFFEGKKRMHFRRMHDRMSSHDKTIRSQQEFFAPRTRGRFFLESWTHQWKYLVAIERAPLSPVVKLDLAAHVLRRMITLRGDLIRELVGGFKWIVSPRWALG